MQEPFTTVQYDKTAFIDFLQTVKEQELCTVRDNASLVGTFVKSGKSPEDFIRSYEKPNSYNNALIALKHYRDFPGVPRPNLKPRPCSPRALIIAPKPAEIIDISAYLHFLLRPLYLRTVPQQEQRMPTAFKKISHSLQ